MVKMKFPKMPKMPKIPAKILTAMGSYRDALAHMFGRDNQLIRQMNSIDSKM